VLDPDKMGLQVLDPAQGCNDQVRPRVVLHGNENHECSDSAFFSAEKSKECVGSMCHTIERTDRQTGLSKLIGLRSEPELLPYHSSLLIIYIKAAMLVFDL
jgi:hypothetical protein